MDKKMLGRRLADAREVAGLSQTAVGEAVGLDRTAVSRIESGDRNLNVVELVRIAQVLGRPLAHFVAAPEPGVVSRRSDPSHAHGSSRGLDLALEGFTSDVRFLSSLSMLSSLRQRSDSGTPTTHDEAEALARETRNRLGLTDQPAVDLGWLCQRLGLLVHSASLGLEGPDGACVEVTTPDETVGVAVINGDRPSGRRRMTTAHELGHWLAGDAYDSGAPADAERFINSFAIHFLAPRAGVIGAWSRDDSLSTRDRLLTIAAEFRLSWSAAVGQASNLRLIDQSTFRRLVADEPTAGDYLRLGLTWDDELRAGYLSPVLLSASLNGYARGRLTRERTLELVRGVLGPDELPHVDDPDDFALSRALDGHGG